MAHFKQRRNDRLIVETVIEARDLFWRCFTEKNPDWAPLPTSPEVVHCDHEDGGVAVVRHSSGRLELLRRNQDGRWRRASTKVATYWYIILAHHYLKGLARIQDDGINILEEAHPPESEPSLPYVGDSPPLTDYDVVVAPEEAAMSPDSQQTGDAETA